MLPIIPIFKELYVGLNSLYSDYYQNYMYYYYYLAKLVHNNKSLLYKAQQKVSRLINSQTNQREYPV